MVSLRNLRVAKGWSQRDLALIAGVSPALIALVETGERRLGQETRSRIARALELREEDARRVEELSAP